MEIVIKRAAESCGGLSKLAELLGVSIQTVNNWRSRGVPIERCAELERATAGAVTRQQLRPHDWHRIWPELAEQSGQGGGELAQEAG